MRVYILCIGLQKKIYVNAYFDDLLGHSDENREEETVDILGKNVENIVGNIFFLLRLSDGNSI